jgi:hypothetical protein
VAAAHARTFGRFARVARADALQQLVYALVAHSSDDTAQPAAAAGASPWVPYATLRNISVEARPLEHP